MQKYSKKAGGENLPKGIVKKQTLEELKAMPGKHFITKKDTGIFKINWY